MNIQERQGGILQQVRYKKSKDVIAQILICSSILIIHSKRLAHWKTENSNITR